MAKKRVEEKMPDLENIKIDVTPEERLQEIPKRVKEEEETYTKPMSKSEEKKEVVNCLRNERVIVRFVPSPNAMVHNKGHVLSGGMAESATRSFVVPRLSTGAYKNVLTDSEKAFLEKAMGLEENALSVYRKRDNFWDDTNPDGIGKVILHKQDNYLDLSNPADYIRYKVLLNNKDYICPSLQELEDRPKATYQFVIINEHSEAQMNLSKNETIIECYAEYGTIRHDADTLRAVLEILTGRPVATMTKLDFLQGKTIEYIQKDPRTFLRVIKDDLLPAKVLIKKAVEAGVITRRNDLYYYEGSPLCEMGEDSTLNNSAKYISNAKRTELKFMLEAKIKKD
jgi:hypothetical protein